MREWGKIGISSRARRDDMEKKKSGFSHDSAQTAYETGRAYYDAQEYDRAVACFLQAADAGHTDAENCLGCCYEAGQGVPRDDKAAVNHYRHAAWHGNVFAQYNLGNCYFEGRGVKRDREGGVRVVSSRGAKRVCNCTTPHGIVLSERDRNGEKCTRGGELVQTCGKPRRHTGSV